MTRRRKRDKVTTTPAAPRRVDTTARSQQLDWLIRDPDGYFEAARRAADEQAAKEYELRRKRRLGGLTPA